ncbi:MAG TPA: hypothetical protein VG103_04655 [Chthoniobacterales bacterium]|jgi:hypothetical protein|nr:hypothetical protein [Chthoniobacterales bacterium]
MLTTFLILGGVAVLLFVSQLASEGIIKPYVEYRKALGEISYTLIYQGNLIVSAPLHSKRDEQVEISESLRQLSARLRSAITALPFHELMRLLQLIPSQERIQEAAARLVRISNLLLETEQKRHDEIRQDMAAIGALLQIDVAKEK